MLSQSPLLRRSARWVLVGLFVIGVAAAADTFGDAVSAVVAATVFGF